MTPLQQPLFDLELSNLCKRFNIAFFAGFYVSDPDTDSLNGVTVAAPNARKNKMTFAYIENVADAVQAVMDGAVPLPDSIT